MNGPLQVFALSNRKRDDKWSEFSKASHYRRLLTSQQIFVPHKEPVDPDRSRDCKWENRASRAIGTARVRRRNGNDDATTTGQNHAPKNERSATRRSETDEVRKQRMEKVTRGGGGNQSTTRNTYTIGHHQTDNRPLRKEIPGLQTAHKRRRRTTEQTRHHLTDRPWNTSLYSKNINENSSVSQRHEESTKGKKKHDCM